MLRAVSSSGEGLMRTTLERIKAVVEQEQE
jgi:hypothetical protein